MSTPNTQVDSKRREQSNVLSRFFPLSAKQSNNSPSQELGVGSGNNVNPKQRSCVVEPKFLKVRIVTWNMHDSLPKGCLEELLGKVPYFESVSTYSGTFPPLANDANHPFHLVVIAGQECPTPSGIPMGLGAGFKLIDKDRREYDKDDKPNPEGKDKDTVEEHREGNHEKLSNGWTQMLEDWLCNGHGANSIASPSSSEIGTPRPLVRQRPKEPRKGPYQLLTKDRLMGIYLALYIHRDLKPLVQGISKASVTTGLIGGRLGNKGGVGISVKIDGATFLFLNAHLAAHEGKVNHRLANLAKIKTELDVDTFLASDDPRAMAEDLTDKFDYTFLFGDLNFRLDISRLHADWLISHQEYAQAFAFDQLNAVMKKGAAFDGFHEAPIDFPPTFKYDVQRTRRPKRLKTLRPGKQFPFQIDRDQAEVVEYGGDEAADVVSLSSTSTHSRTIVEQAWDVSNQAEPPTPNLVESNRIGLNSTKLSKPKWLSILSPSVVTTPRLPRFLHPDSLTSSPVTPHTTLSSLFPESVTTVKNIPAKKRFIRPPPMILTPSSASQSSFFDGDLEEDKGVYDSSSKQRVPSWCDRILWKTTIIKDPVPIENSNLQTRRRVSQFFANAFRSPSRTSSRDPNGANVPANRSPTSMGVIAETRALTAVPSNNKHRGPLSSRRAKTTFTPPPTAPLVQLSPRRSTTGSSERPRSASASIWRFLPAFLSPSHTNPAAETLQLPTHPTYIKGDVVCLNYGTLDDREMGRLEGRSDHRPVIGAYKNMQGFNKYYPPDYDPSQGSLNKARGKHALGDRARKLEQGILIVRFELPFNIWCGTCNNHIGMGVRYNAEKKKVGSYYSTPIFSFRCKCHLCDGWFEIQTDPKNTRYVVVSGARQKDEEWNPEDNGGFAIHDTDKESASALDPLAALEKTTDAKRLVENVQKPRIESLQNVSEHFNADPYSLSLKARKKFREEKKVEQAKRKADDALKGRYGLPTSLSLVEEDEKSIKEAKVQWEKAKSVVGERDPKRRRLSMSGPYSFSSPSLKPVDSLRTKLLQNTAKRSASSSSLHSSRP